MTAIAVTKKRHYTLVTGEIVFLSPDPNKPGEFEGPYAVRINTIITDDLPLITEKLIGEAQQSLQIQFFNGRDPNLQVQDVVILNLSPLGRMSKEEFHKVPQGMVRREVTTDPLLAGETQQ